MAIQDAVGAHLKIADSLSLLTLAGKYELFGQKANLFDRSTESLIPLLVARLY